MATIVKPMPVVYKPGSILRFGDINRPTKAQLNNYLLTQSLTLSVHKYNYESMPGSHTQFSPVVGARYEEYASIRAHLNSKDYVKAFECAIYCDRSLIYLIPIEHKEQADALAAKFLQEKIDKYPTSGLTASNVVTWIESGNKAPTDVVRIIPGFKFEVPWRVNASVKLKDDIQDGKYIPKDLIACHELEHVEETPVFAYPGMFTYGLRELLTRMGSLLLTDEIYRTVHGIGMSQRVDYNKTVYWEHNSAELGDIISFFRGLKTKYGTLAKAFLSDEALLYMRTGGKPLILVN